MCEEECITSWNNAISGFKLSSKFFQDCNPSEIKRALEELFRYCGINVDDINKNSQQALVAKLAEMNLPSGGELETSFYILKLICGIYSVIATGNKVFCLYDIYSIGPKRLIRILRELLNFFLFYKLQNDKIIARLRSTEEEQYNKTKELEDVRKSNRALEKEIRALDAENHKLKQSFPQTNEELEKWMQNLQEVQQDVKQLEEQAKAEEKEIQIQLELETKLQLECEELKGYLVHNSENLRSTLINLEAEHEELVEMNNFEEASIRSKINSCSEIQKSLVSGSDLIDELKKCINLGKTCEQICEELPSHTAMMNKIDLNNLEKQLTEATDNLKALQSYFDELSIKYEAVRDSVPKQCNDIIKDNEAYTTKNIVMNNEIKKIIKVIDQIEIAMDRIDESKAADNDLKVELTQLALKMINETHQKSINKSKELEEKYRLDPGED